MRYPVLLAEVIYIICFQSVSALTNLVERQACGSITCPDWTKIWGGITGAAAGSAAWWSNLSQPTSPSITTPENSPPVHVGPPVPDKTPEIEIFVTGESNVCDRFDPSGSRAEGNLVSNSRKFLSI